MIFLEWNLFNRFYRLRELKHHGLGLKDQGKIKAVTQRKHVVGCTLHFIMGLVGKAEHPTSPVAPDSSELQKHRWIQGKVVWAEEGKMWHSQLRG